MIVVSNTSPLTNLAAVGRFDLLRSLYEHVRIPAGVWSELNAGGQRWPGCEEVEQAGWVEVLEVENRPLIAALRRDLGQGEAEAIALALECGSDLLLIDEKEGRHAAQALGLRAAGVVGILLEAKRRGFLEAIRPDLDALRSRAGFFLSDRVYSAALELAFEFP